MTHWLRIWSRNLRRFKLYTLINIAGLSLAMAAMVAIYLYVTDELSYDKFHSKGDLIFRINTVTTFSGVENRYFTTSAPLADAAKTDIADIDRTVRLFERQASIQITDSKSSGVNGQKFREDHFYFCDPSVFEVFTFQFLKGAASTALVDPSGLVITKSIAEKYFGSVEAAMGKDLLFEGHRMLTISGIIENYPHQSHLRIEMLAHFEHYYTEERPEIQEYLRSDWLYNPILTYVLLKPNANVADVEASLNAIKKKYGDERVINGVKFELQPLNKIHLYSSFTFAGQSANIRYVYFLVSIGLLILFTACVNFINLSNVHSLKRAKEIGVRKVLGARVQGLMLQFLGESSAMVMVSFILAFGIVCVAISLVNEVTGKHFTLISLVSGDLFMGLFLIFVLTALLAGLYPSLYATRFNPTVVLKGLQSHRDSKGFPLRKVLLVFQFSVSGTLLVMGTLFYQQMQFIRSKPLGFQREHILTIPLFSDTPNAILGGGVDGPLRARMNTFENELLKKTIVEAVSLSSALPGAGAVNALVQTDKIKSEDNVFVAALAVDYDFMDTYKMEVIAGRNFSQSFGTDHLQSFIINERAVNTLGWTNPDQALGQRIELLGKQGTIIGVVKDFHYEGLQQPLRPLILEVAAGKFTVFSIRLRADQNFVASIHAVQETWNKIFPEKVFEYHFLDDRLELNYGTEQRMLTILEYFACLAILISALGLFGLAAYINHMRAKEVCIRKVLGATVTQVFYTLSREFFKLAAVSFLISIPIVFIFASQWLNSYAYKVELTIVPFLVGGFVVFITVFLTVSYETLKTATLNPVEKLREE
jgi:putative ABC transport system permease protein